MHTTRADSMPSKSFLFKAHTEHFPSQHYTALRPSTAVAEIPKGWRKGVSMF